MSLSASDLIFYGSANMPEADGSTAGGAIDTTTYVVFDSATLANTLNDTVEILSGNSGDTSQTVTITGRSASGAIVSETLNLNGTSVVAGSTSFERILKIVVSGAHTGAITVRKATGDTLIVTIPSGILTVRRPFYNVASDASGGSTRNYYEKIFVKNTNGSFALNDAALAEGSDPSGTLTFALETSKGGTGTSTNRQTAPASGVGTFDSSSKSITGGLLDTSETQGIWLKLTLTAALAAAKTTYQLDLTGTTT